MSSGPPSLATRLRSEKTRPKTSFSSSSWERGLRAVGPAGLSLVLGAVLARVRAGGDGARAAALALEEGVGGAQRRE